MQLEGLTPSQSPIVGFSLTAGTPVEVSQISALPAGVTLEKFSDPESGTSWKLPEANIAPRRPKHENYESEKLWKSRFDECAKPFYDKQNLFEVMELEAVRQMQRDSGKMTTNLYDLVSVLDVLKKLDTDFLLMDPADKHGRAMIASHAAELTKIAAIMRRNVLPKDVIPEPFTDEKTSARFRLLADDILKRKECKGTLVVLDSDNAAKLLGSTEAIAKERENLEFLGDVNRLDVEEYLSLICQRNGWPVEQEKIRKAYESWLTQVAANAAGIVTGYIDHLMQHGGTLLLADNVILLRKECEADPSSSQISNVVCGLHMLSYLKEHLPENDVIHPTKADIVD